jgi:hypothetical protein
MSQYIYINPTDVSLTPNESGNYHLFFKANDKEYPLTLICPYEMRLEGKSIKIECDELQNKLGQVESIEVITQSFFEVRIHFKDGTMCVIGCKSIEGCLS